MRHESKLWLRQYHLNSCNCSLIHFPPEYIEGRVTATGLTVAGLQEIVSPVDICN